MNKLVLTAALLVAAASSFAITSPAPELTADVYSVSISMKTTKANVGPIEALHYRTVASKTYNGFYIVDVGDFDGSYDGNEILLGYEGRVLDDEVRWNDVVRIGKNNTEIEASGMIFGGNMIVFLRGFGTYDQKNERVSSLNGSINAFLPPPVLFGLESEPVFGRDLSNPQIVEDEEGTIGFGTFSVKYNLEASKKLALESYATLEYFARKLGCDINDLPFGG